MLSKKKQFKKKHIDVSIVERTVKQVATKKKEPTCKLSVTLPKPLYREMKKRAVELDMTVKDNFTGLLVKIWVCSLYSGANGHLRKRAKQ